jgi:DNA mismatch repair protein MutS
MSTNIIDEYFEYYKKYIKEYGDKTCILYAVGSFYEVYRIENENETIGNAHIIADILHFAYSNKNKAKRLESGSTRAYPDFCGFNTSYLSKHLPILLENDYTVVLIEQLEDGSNKSGKICKRGVKAIHSPCLQPLDYTNEQAFNLVGLYIEVVQDFSIKNKEIMMYSICCINNSTNTIELLESNVSIFNKQIHNCFEDIGRMLLQYNPREIICKYNCSYNYQDTIYKLLSSNYNCKVEAVDMEILQTYSKIPFQNNYFSKVYKHINFGLLQPIISLSLEKYPLSILNLMFVFDFMAKHDLKYISNLNIPTIIEDSKCLVLELNTLTQLNILNNNSKKNSKFNSVFDVINFTTTTIGKRYLKKLLCQPFKDPEVIESRYIMTEEMKSIDLDFLDNCLNQLVDFERFHRKMGLDELHPFEFEKLHTNYIKITSIIEYFYSNKGTIETLFNITPKNKVIVDFNEYIQDYKKTFDLNKMKGSNLNTNYINYFNKGITQGLDEIEDKIVKFEQDIELLRERYDNKINNNKQQEFIKLACTDQEGYHFTCTKIRYQTLLKALSKEECDNITTRQTSNSCKLFTKDLTKLSNDLVNYRELLHKRVKQEYLSKLQGYYNKYNNIFSKLKEFVEIIDVTRSNLKCSQKYNYCKPTIDIDGEDSFVKANEIRHPIVERLDLEFITNDISICKDNLGILLYGLNSCGKSTLLRAIGVNVILAQIGYYVPCKTFHFSPFHTLISQVDMSDNLFTGKSSFTSEMTSLKRILQCSGKNTLVLADELCKTTEYFSAQGIVASTILKLIKNKTCFFFTTHLHELPKINEIGKEPCLQICHLSIKIKNNIVMFERKLNPGSGSDLYGLEIAKNILDDSDLIDKAFEIRNKITKNKTSVVSLKKSVYNKKKIISECEVCGSNQSLETHHINFQSNCDENGYVNNKYFHKNELFNLVCLCKSCHLKIDKGLIIHGYKDSLNGKILDFIYSECE